MITCGGYCLMGRPPSFPSHTPTTNGYPTSSLHRQELITFINECTLTWGERTRLSTNKNLQQVDDNWQAAADAASPTGATPQYLEKLFQQLKSAFDTLVAQVKLAAGKGRQTYDQFRLAMAIKHISKLLVDTVDCVGISFPELETVRSTITVTHPTSRQEAIFQERLADCEGSLSDTLHKLLADHNTQMLRLFSIASIAINTEAKQKALQDNNKQQVAAIQNLGKSIANAMHNSSGIGGSSKAPGSQITGRATPQPQDGVACKPKPN